MFATDKNELAQPESDLRVKPSFIIGGAPKCATTTLHSILNQHPDIALPDEEVMFFDADDPVTHNDILRTKNGKVTWLTPDTDLAGSTDEAKYYASRFSPFAGTKFIGEDSTTYLFSAVAAQRIARQLPDAKLIFMLRNPVKRAYSQYWHMMNSARISLTFEQAITRVSNIILGSTYTQNLRAYYDLFPAEQIKVILFEDFIGDLQAGIDDVTRFLGADAFKVDPEKAWFNKTLYTKHVLAQRAMNKLARGIAASRYRTHMSDAKQHSIMDRLSTKIHNGFFNHLYPMILKSERPPEMNADTRAYLEYHLTARNKGLSELLNRDVKSVWGLDV